MNFLSTFRAANCRRNRETKTFHAGQRSDTAAYRTEPRVLRIAQRAISILVFAIRFIHYTFISRVDGENVLPANSFDRSAARRGRPCSSNCLRGKFCGRFRGGKLRRHAGTDIYTSLLYCTIYWLLSGQSARIAGGPCCELLRRDGMGGPIDDRRYTASKENAYCIIHLSDRVISDLKTVAR